jgi:hypothetical protein
MRKVWRFLGVRGVHLRRDAHELIVDTAKHHQQTTAETASQDTDNQTDGSSHGTVVASLCTHVDEWENWKEERHSDQDGHSHTILPQFGFNRHVSAPEYSAWNDFTRVKAERTALQSYCSDENRGLHLHGSPYLPFLVFQKDGCEAARTVYWACISSPQASQLLTLVTSLDNTLSGDER